MPSRYSLLRLLGMLPEPARGAQTSGEMPSGGGPCGSPAHAVRGGEGAAAVELLDEYWYSRNVLGSREVGVPARLPPARGSGNGGAPSCSDATEKEAAAVRNSAGESPPAGKSPLRRSLLRMPSLPPRVGREKPAQECACPHHGSAGAAKLRHSYSNLESVLLLSPSGSRRHLSSKSAPGKQRPRRDAKVESIIRYVDGHHRAITGAGRRRSFQVKKWRSLSDLETEEVQGLRDLGFVFDQEAVNPCVLEVVPGLRPPAAEGERCGGGDEDAKVVQRPYLSEAWLVQRSAPPALDWVGGGSAADVKEQLRFWARVVASNVRQEC